MIENHFQILKDIKDTHEKTGGLSAKKCVEKLKNMGMADCEVQYNTPIRRLARLICSSKSVAHKRVKEMFRKGEISIFHDIYRAVEDYPLTDEMKAVWDYDEKCEPIIKWVYGHSFYSRLVGCVCVNAGNIYKVVRQPDIYLRNKRW